MLEVEPRRVWNEDTTNLMVPYVVFQLLELPKFCPCENKKLRKFDAAQKIQGLN
ncbi:hypothetical protein AsAng_0047840 [Aureispira anguillae]|uniref:Uncharacterized protein n=1 Tax=Aureispira anguillae TaxID=2864201 RepID=A0A916DWG5_9BACT|nr:hypothetical protein AsAng_0047840 [Aureispira anguillae]